MPAPLPLPPLPPPLTPIIDTRTRMVTPEWRKWFEQTTAAIAAALAAIP
jgi:hypothetical protein